jgi:hypothetical protein
MNPLSYIFASQKQLYICFNFGTATTQAWAVWLLKSALSSLLPGCAKVTSLGCVHQLVISTGSTHNFSIPFNGTEASKLNIIRLLNNAQRLFQEGDIVQLQLARAGQFFIPSRWTANPTDVTLPRNLTILFNALDTRTTLTRSSTADNETNWEGFTRIEFVKLTLLNINVELRNITQATFNKCLFSSKWHWSTYPHA